MIIDIWVKDTPDEGWSRKEGKKRQLDNTHTRPAAFSLLSHALELCTLWIPTSTEVGLVWRLERQG